jgi:2-polyprenyl-3-methyl-5-hydroxy-6-metoxy-1,4-benzoquinol methylase
VLGVTITHPTKVSILNAELTDRQQRELDYHREHARLHKSILNAPFSWEVLQNPEKRWWNAYWTMYEYLMSCELRDKEVLVVGCGFGDDALRLAKLGARVRAFDLSPDCLEIAKALALREGLDVDFQQMPAESLLYSNDTFDYILARDILHHVDIPKAMREIVRVSLSRMQCLSLTKSTRTPSPTGSGTRLSSNVFCTRRCDASFMALGSRTLLKMRES